MLQDPQEHQLSGATDRRRDHRILTPRREVPDGNGEKGAGHSRRDRWANERSLVVSTEAAVFGRWREPTESRGSSSVLGAARGKTPGDAVEVSDSSKTNRIGHE
jgi:hypothetical protein